MTAATIQANIPNMMTATVLVLIAPVYSHLNVFTKF